MKRNEIEKVIKIQREQLDKGYFFEDLIGNLIKKNLLEPEVIKDLQMQLLNLLALQIEAYNAGKSSSIPKKEADKLMQSIYFTLGFYLKGVGDLDSCILLLQTKPLKEMFEEGRGQIEERVEEVKVKFNKLSSEWLPINNIAYQDTYQKSLIPFFASYKPKFFSQEMNVSIDYPLSIDDMTELGIEYMDSFISKSILENNLCRKFKTEEIEALLKNYEKGYVHLLINIYEIVLLNVLGRKILDQTLDQLVLEEKDLKRLQQRLEEAEKVEIVLWQAAEESLKDLALDHKEMNSYVKLTLQKLMPHIKQLLKEEKLEQIFIVSKAYEEKPIVYTGGEKLSDEAFKVLTEEIRSCRRVNDKIKWIREKITHAEDLKDILEAECFFDDEYLTLYSELSTAEIALLLHGEMTDEFGKISLEEEDKDWKKILVSYLNKQIPEKKEEIINLAAHIIEDNGDNMI